MSGHVRRIDILLRWVGIAALALSTSGCAMLPAAPDSARAQLDFMSQAMSASPSAREAMWQAARTGGTSARAELRVALLQSIPDHSGYDPGAAQRRLKALLARHPSAGLAAVARTRIAELAESDSCRKEVADMQRRMTMMVDIERRQDQQKH
ncbi:MAG: hypothetical protein ACRETM_07425 [Stenotrophobium sp.]